jgi:hypothetical protein
MPIVNTVLDASKVISGNYVKVFTADGAWLSNAKSIEATVEIGKEEIQRSGTRWVGHKATTLTGSGTLSGYLVTTELLASVAQIANDEAGSYVTELRAKLADPEAYGAYDVRLKNVQFDNIPLINAEVGSIVEQELPFTFSEFEFLNLITR